MIKLTTDFKHLTGHFDILQVVAETVVVLTRCRVDEMSCRRVVTLPRKKMARDSLESRKPFFKNQAKRFIFFVTYIWAQHIRELDLIR